MAAPSQPHARDLKDLACWKKFAEGTAQIFTIPLAAHLTIFNNLHLVDAVSLSLTCTYLYALSPTRYMAIRRAERRLANQPIEPFKIPLNLGAPDIMPSLVRGCLHCLPGLYYPAHCELHFHIEKFMPDDLQYCNTCVMFTLNFEEAQRHFTLERASRRQTPVARGGVLFDWVPKLYDNVDEESWPSTAHPPDANVEEEEDVDMDSDEESLPSTAHPPDANVEEEEDVDVDSDKESLPSTVRTWEIAQNLDVEMEGDNSVPQDAQATDGRAQPEGIEHGKFLRLLYYMEATELLDRIRAIEQEISRIQRHLPVITKRIPGPPGRSAWILATSEREQDLDVDMEGDNSVPQDAQATDGRAQPGGIEPGEFLRLLDRIRAIAAEPPRIPIQRLLSVITEPDQWIPGPPGRSGWMWVLSTRNLLGKEEEVCGRCFFPYKLADSLANDYRRQSLVPRQNQIDRIRRWLMTVE